MIGKEARCPHRIRKPMKHHDDWYDVCKLNGKLCLTQYEQYTYEIYGEWLKEVKVGNSNAPVG